MIFLPRKIRDYYQQKADELGQNLGSYLIALLIEKAMNEGVTCSHPLAVQVLYKKGKTKVDKHGFAYREKDTMRCTLCGSMWEKVDK